uniref:Uncharacterized protein n=1 Tax=Steinernema glaseri TaxID=37863 RepID=A0A1I7Y9N5_9BILA
MQTTTCPSKKGELPKLKDGHLEDYEATTLKHRSTGHTSGYARIGFLTNMLINIHLKNQSIAKKNEKSKEGGQCQRILRMPSCATNSGEELNSAARVHDRSLASQNRYDQTKP